MQGFSQFRNQQGRELTESLKDSMVAFADKLEQVLGGQVGHAKELQQQTLLALEKAVGSFQAMALQIGQAGKAATSSMSSHLDKAIADMAVQHERMNATVRALVDELREAAVRAQATTGAAVEQLLADLGEQVERTLGSVQDQLRVGKTALVEISPGFEGAPERWLEFEIRVGQATA